jgi:centromeric protein E
MFAWAVTHPCFYRTFQLIESKGIDDAVQVSQLNLVDLAGSEKTGASGSTGSTFKEGCHINKSLTVLGKVINDLSENPEG